MKQNTSSLQTADGLTLFTQSWKPEHDPKAAVLLLHGLAEHSGRYVHVAQAFVSSGYAVYTFDGRGHGQSSGKNAYFDSLDAYLGDIDLALAQMQQEQNGIPHFLLGHSMGGAMAAMFAITRQPELNGLVLSGPAVKQGEDVPELLIKLAPILGKWLPRLPAMKLDGSSVSRDPAVIERYNNDPLNFRGAVPARTGANLIEAIDRIQAGMSSIKLPILLMHGTADRLTTPEGSQMLYDHVSSIDKTIKLYEGLYHEIFNEPEQDQVLTDTITWCDVHL